MNKQPLILVTGGTGFLGSYVCRMLVRSGYKVRVLQRQNATLDLLEEVSDQIEFINGDLLDITSLENACQGVDKIVHAAAVIGFNPATRKKMYKVNVTGTANLVNVALDFDVKHFVHISSTAALGRKSKKEHIDEQCQWVKSRYNSHYAVSKRKAEMHAWRGLSEGLPVTVINPAVIFGASFWHRPPVNLIAKIYQGLNFYPVGTNGFVDVRDVGLFVKKVIEYELIGENYILSATSMPWKVVFEKIAAEIGVSSPQFGASKLLSSIAVPWFRMKSWFSGADSTITYESTRISRGQFTYANEKSLQVKGFSYRSFRKTIEETCRQFLKTYPHGQKYGLLPLDK